jgi:hypothetical protein
MSMAYENDPVLSVIELGGKTRKIVVITYTNKKGETKLYATEPYEVKAGFYWGFDTDDQSIKKFALSSIAQAQLSSDSYVPRWEVKF